MYTKRVWPDEVSPELEPYWSQRTEITIERECFMWGVCVTIPECVYLCVLYMQPHF